jgi:hypothetical protein
VRRSASGASQVGLDCRLTTLNEEKVQMRDYKSAGTGGSAGRPTIAGRSGRRLIVVAVIGLLVLGIAMAFLLSSPEPSGPAADGRPVDTGENDVIPLQLPPPG